MASRVGQVRPGALTANILTFGAPENAQRWEEGGQPLLLQQRSLQGGSFCPAEPGCPSTEDPETRRASSCLGKELDSNSGLLLPFPTPSTTAHPKAWPLQPCLACLPSCSWAIYRAWLSGLQDKRSQSSRATAHRAFPRGPNRLGSVCFQPSKRPPHSE